MARPRKKQSNSISNNNRDPTRGPNRQNLLNKTSSTVSGYANNYPEALNTHINLDTLASDDYDTIDVIPSSLDSSDDFNDENITAGGSESDSDYHSEGSGSS